MAVYLVTYDLKAPAGYQPVYDYFEAFPEHCKGLESVYLLDTTIPAKQIRDGLKALVKKGDIILVTRLQKLGWASLNYPCSDWLKDTGRNW